jgi:Holliday junction resolvase RusA-like endonuclease
MSNPFLDKTKPRGERLNLVVIDDYQHPAIEKLHMVRGVPLFIPCKQTILGVVPSKSNCYRIVTIPCKAPKKPFSSLAKTKELKEYERSFGLQCTRYRNAGIQTDFRFEMDVYYPSRRADLDGCLKIVLDCLQPKTPKRPFGVGAVENDNKCQEITIRRHIDTSNPRIEFVITPLNS